jgi:preprotein translocase subunit YajC
MEQSILFALVLFLALGAYWSLVIFPRQREFEKRQKYVQTLNSGDEMITYGGVIGKVVEVQAEQGIALVELAPGIVVRMLIQSLVQPYEPEKLAEAARKVSGSDKTDV